MTEHPGLQGRAAVVEVVEELRRELIDGAVEPWHNDTLERFFDAFGALLGVIENPHVNTGHDVPSDPWVRVAYVLRGARYYE